MMRNPWVVFCLLALLILPVGASGMNLLSKGVKGGMIYSNMAGDDVSDASSKLGFGGGAWLNFSLLNQIELQPELLYAMKGAKTEGEWGEATTSIDYVEVPVLASYSLPLVSPWTPKLQFGPYLGYNTRANMSMEGDRAEEEDVDLKDETAQLDYGVVLGVGVAVARVSLDARYTMGLTSISDPSEGDAMDVKNRSISLLFGISF